MQRKYNAIGHAIGNANRAYYSLSYFGVGVDSKSCRALNKAW
jgi:hypothetical protein